MSWSSDEDHQIAAKALEISSCDPPNCETTIPLTVISKEYHRDDSDSEESSSFGGRIEMVEGEVKRRDEEGEGEGERGEGEGEKRRNGAGEGEGKRGGEGEGDRRKEREREVNGKEKTNGRSRLPKKNKYSIPLPLKYPHTITFMYNKSTMEGTIRPPTKDNKNFFTFSIRLKTVHNQSTMWPVSMSFHVFLVHKKRLLWNKEFGDECDGSKKEFCTINIPRAVIERCKDKVELRLSI